jgi:AcrR family transcriptional regulator
LKTLKREPGRPAQNDSDPRQALISAARLCFASLPYRDVTTRMLAEKANVNAALIRYYFLSKDGLYQQMLAGLAEQFQQNVSHFIEQSPDKPFEALLRAHAKISADSPDAPKLIFKELAFNEGQGRQLVIENIVKPNKKFLSKILSEMYDDETIRADFNPLFLMMSILSISIVPHLLKDVFEQVDDIVFDEQKIEKMIWQNTQLLQFGCLVTGDSNV